MVEDEQIAQSKAIQRQTGKTFHFATRLLPDRVREATYVLYAFFRLADEVVDDVNGETPDEQREQLESFRRQALGEAEADDPVLAAFAEMRDRYDIPDSDVHSFIDAMLADIEKSRYATYEELERYMDGSAAAVGRMMTAVMETDEDEKALPHATALGEAFQMSNFLRDVREDIVERDRVYLPQTTLAEHGVSEEQLHQFETDDSFRAVMETELHRTESLYKDGVAGIKYLPQDCQFAVLLAAVMYADHHRLIRRRNYDVLSATPSLSTTRKIALFVKTRWHWQWNRDPEAVFRKVSTVSYREPSNHGAERPDHMPVR